MSQHLMSLSSMSPRSKSAQVVTRFSTSTYDSFTFIYNLKTIHFTGVTRS